MFFKYFSYEPEDLPVVTFSIFRFSIHKRWRAFRQMGERFLLKNAPESMTFGKMLGSGKNGFDILPDFSQYSLLACWKTAEAAETFFTENERFRHYSADTEEIYHIQMLPLQSKGTWEGKNPFKSENAAPVSERPLIVLTRATIHPSKLLSFWQHVPKARQAVWQSAGMLAAFGIGELPIVQQATLSIWENAESIKNFAYQKTFHKEVVQETRRQNWYSEELFARFTLTATQGTYKGKDIIEEHIGKSALQMQI